MGRWGNVHGLVWEWVYRPVTRTRHPNSFIVKTCRRGCLVRVKSQIDVHWVAVGNLVRLQGVKGDYRYPIPHIQDLTQCLAGSKIFSKIDLVRAYYQIQ